MTTEATTDKIRTAEEVRQAIALLGASFASREHRNFVWQHMPAVASQAWAAFQVLGWMVHAEESEFQLILEYCARKLRQYEGEADA